MRKQKPLEIGSHAMADNNSIVTRIIFIIFADGHGYEDLE